MDEKVWGGIWFTIAVLTLPIGLLTALFVGLQAALVVFIIGWLLLLPLIVIIKEFLGTALNQLGSDRPNPTDDSENPLNTLKKRYAEGEIDEDEFEQKVDDLISTEGIEIDSKEANRKPEREPEKEYDPN